MEQSYKTPQQLLSAALSAMLPKDGKTPEIIAHNKRAKKLLDSASERIQARMEKNDACPLERTDDFMPAWEEKIS